MTDITDHLAFIERRVAAALVRSNRPADSVSILAVSKGQTAAAIRAAYLAGLLDFGENYVDEATGKMAALTDLPLVWHFIGRVQANKTRIIAERFGWVHTIDRPRIAQRLAAQRSPHAPPLNVLIQVNLAAESQKGGIAAGAIGPLAALIDSLPRLRLRGLMTLPPAGLDDTAAREHFGRIRELAVLHDSPTRRLDTLSMGMSDDYPIAVECGSTCIRVGTALFGPRGEPATAAR